MWLWDRCSTLWLLFFSPTQLTANNFTSWRSSGSGVVSLSETVTLCCGFLATLLHAFEQISFLVGFADSSQNSTSLSHWRRKWLKSRGRPFQLFSPSKYDKSKKEHLQLLSQISYLHLLLTRCWGYFTCQEDAAHNNQNVLSFFPACLSEPRPQPLPRCRSLLNPWQGFGGGGEGEAAAERRSQQPGSGQSGRRGGRAHAQPCTDSTGMDVTA